MLFIDCSWLESWACWVWTPLSASWPQSTSSISLTGQRYSSIWAYTSRLCNSLIPQIIWFFNSWLWQNMDSDTDRHTRWTLTYTHIHKGFKHNTPIMDWHIMDFNIHTMDSPTLCTSTTCTVLLWLDHCALICRVSYLLHLLDFSAAVLEYYFDHFTFIATCTCFTHNCISLLILFIIHIQLNISCINLYLFSSMH